MAGIRIITAPRGMIFQQGNSAAQLQWNPEFAKQRTQQFSRKQQFVDSEVLRRCSPRVPFQTGMLDKSGTLGTVIGSGEVKYIAPYAAHQYYNTSQARPYDARRGGKWFERMKAEEKEDILRGADKI